MLHHLTLGWSKKAILNLKDNHFSAETLNVVCAILDTCVIWKVMYHYMHEVLATFPPF